MRVSAASLIPRLHSRRAESVSTDLDERLFVYTVWAAASAALFLFIVRYGPDVPWMDDWELVPVLTGARPVTAAWLWIQQNEHRFPVTKALLVAAARLTGGDFRAGMFASAVLLSAVALAAVRVAARLRGRASYMDAAFPLLLLHPGHGHNVLGHIQLFFVSAWALVMTVALLVARDRCTPARSAAGLAACLWLLPLHGAAGALFAPGAALWAIHSGCRFRRGEQRRAAAFLLVGGIGALVLSGWYFIGLVRPASHPRSPSLAASVITAGQVAGASLGRFGEQTWPLATIGVGLLTAATLFRLLSVVRAVPAERTRALGLLVVAVAVAVILAGTGAARAGFGPRAGFEARYALMGTSLLVALAFAWMLYGGAAGRFVNLGLFTAACMSFSVNVQHGLAYGRERKADADALRAAVRAGMPPTIVARHHFARFYPAPQIMARRLRMLHGAGQGPYRGLPSSAAITRCGRWEAIALKEAGTYNLDWRDGVGWPRGTDPWVIFTLYEAPRLCAVRLTIVQTAPGRRDAPVKVYWALHENGWFSERRQIVETLAADQPQRIVVWIDDDVDALRVDPDESVGEFRVLRMEMLPDIS